MNSEKNITRAIDTIARDTHLLKTMTKETLTSADLSRMTIECLVNASEQRDYPFDEHDLDRVDWKEDVIMMRRTNLKGIKKLLKNSEKVSSTKLKVCLSSMIPVTKIELRSSQN